MKKVFLIIVILLLFIAIPATIFLVNQSQELRKKAAPATTLAFTPASLTKNVGDTFSLDITINTGENQVVITEIHLAFDPTKLEAQSISNGPLFPRIYASGTVAPGTASITVGATDETKPIRGTGTAAVIRFKALAPTSAPIAVRFVPATTFVGGLGEGSSNLLTGSSPATITIGGSGQTTQSPTPTIATSITPTRSQLQPSLTPTPTKGASQSAEASVSALIIQTPLENESVESGSVTISGKSQPGATITLTIYSTPKTATVIADALGNWVYTANNLETGSHSVVATATVASGNTQTASSSFVITGSSPSEASGGAIPVTGTFSSTVILLIIAMTLIGLGVGIPFAFRL